MPAFLKSLSSSSQDKVMINNGWRPGEWMLFFNGEPYCAWTFPC